MAAAMTTRHRGIIVMRLRIALMADTSHDRAKDPAVIDPRRARENGNANTDGSQSTIRKCHTGLLWISTTQLHIIRSPIADPGTSA
jgi:hypothetical protein